MMEVWRSGLHLCQHAAQLISCYSACSGVSSAPNWLPKTSRPRLCSREGQGVLFPLPRSMLVQPSMTQNEMRRAPAKPRAMT